MHRFAGVIAQYDGQIALVREHYKDWAEPCWNLASGGVEPDESPTAGAVRELREETGLRVAEDALELVWTTAVVHDGVVAYRSWNYIASVIDPAFAIDDPDGSVTDVGWFSPQDAVRLLQQVPHPPLAVPAIAHLDGAPNQSWTFTKPPTPGLGLPAPN